MYNKTIFRITSQHNSFSFLSFFSSSIHSNHTLPNYNVILMTLYLAYLYGLEHVLSELVAMDDIVHFDVGLTTTANSGDLLCQNQGEISRAMATITPN